MIVNKMIEVLEAVRDKKQIQFREIGTTQWKDALVEPRWDFSKLEFRVKPESIKCWANIFHGERMYFDSRDEAVNHAARCIDDGYKVIRVAVPMVEVEE